MGSTTWGMGVSVCLSVCFMCMCVVCTNGSSAIVVSVWSMANSDIGLECWYSYKEKRDVVYVMAM